jgi:hypothetical protein
MAGTTDTTSQSRFDAVLHTALAEDDTPPDSPDNDSTLDEGQDATGLTPDALNAPPSDPATDGAAEQTPSPDGALTPSLADDDPLSDSEPVTVTVDGQTKTLDGFTRVPGGGIIIDEEKVPAFQLMASRAEGLERQNRELYHRTQEYERLSQWKTTKPDGTESTLTGREALEAREIELARTKAWSSVIEHALMTPETFASLVTVNAQGQIVPNIEQLRYLATRAQLASRDAMDEARSRFSSTFQATTQAQQQAQVQQQAPHVLWSQAEQVWGKEFPQLTPDDKQFLSLQVPRYIRPATPQEVQSGQFQANEPVLDPSFYTVMQDRATLRGQMVKTATATDKATKFNQGQQQGRGPNGSRPPVVPPSSSTSPKTPPVHKGRQEKWDEVFLSAVNE